MGFSEKVEALLSSYDDEIKKAKDGAWCQGYDEGQMQKNVEIECKHKEAYDDGYREGYAACERDAAKASEARRRDIGKVKGLLPREELLCQLAEECAELGKAALKVRRAIMGVNPTPVTLEKATDDLLEEFADVTLVAAVLGYEAGIPKVAILWEDKLGRWLDRLSRRVPRKH